MQLIAPSMQIFGQPTLVVMAEDGTERTYTAKNTMLASTKARLLNNTMEFREPPTVKVGSSDSPNTHETTALTTPILPGPNYGSNITVTTLSPYPTVTPTDLILTRTTTYVRVFAKGIQFPGGIREVGLDGANVLNSAKVDFRVVLPETIVVGEGEQLKVLYAITQVVTRPAPYVVQLDNKGVLTDVTVTSDWGPLNYSTPEYLIPSSKHLVLSPRVTPQGGSLDYSEYLTMTSCTLIPDEIGETLTQRWRLNPGVMPVVATLATGIHNTAHLHYGFSPPIERSAVETLELDIIFDYSGLVTP